MKIDCLVCRKEIKFPTYVDVQKYDGHIECRECGSRLQVKLGKGKVQQIKVVRERRPMPSADEIAEAQREAREDGKRFLGESQ